MPNLPRILKMYNIYTIRHPKPPKIRESFLETLAFQQYIYIFANIKSSFHLQLLLGKGDTAKHVMVEHVAAEYVLPDSSFDFEML